ncbi:amino acid adenylation domain-containing protein [Nocardia sp. NPDC052112]|uniref:amino acid adenylation domain-containing protein n=1 Tax=Nocardia sp. NPDC052112 TaxID=3155646 RepID=UPI003440D746
MDIATPPPGGLAQLVRDAAARTPTAPAVHCGPITVTYRELDELADRYAQALRESEVAPGDRVLIWAEKAPEVVAVMQAALRVGAIYVPIAPANPAARVETIAQHCAPALIVTDAARAGRITLRDNRSVELGELLAESSAPGPRADRPVDPDDIAYILFTSGSTGEPKGVCISHRNASAFIDWATAEIGVVAADRLASHAPFNFDLSVFDLYAAFRAGASVDLIPGELAYAAEPLAQFLCERGITIWYSVPSAMQLMLRHGSLLDRDAPNVLRTCLFAGEPFPVTDLLAVRRAWPHIRIFNWYGPTETNVCTSYEVTVADLDRERAVPIGTPASGAVVTLDSSSEGEIVVSGPTVMAGYWGATPHRGPYRTGDLGRYDDAGRLEYIGRRDGMVKVRGHRLELGDVESALSAHPAVAAVAVVVLGTGIDARLHAVVIARDDAQRPTLLALKSHCAARLPTYMIVDTLSVVDELPRTANGKLDRAELVAAHSD